MHYIINPSFIIPCHTAHILGMIFVSHVSLVCRTSTSTPDLNVLDIELLIVNPASWSPSPGEGVGQDLLSGHP